MISEWGYLLPTREQVMTGAMETQVFLDRARLARDLGFDSVWVGDSLREIIHSNGQFFFNTAEITYQ